MPRKDAWVAYGALAAVCFFWGTTYLGIRVALEGLPPALLISLRYWLSGSTLLAIAIWRGAHIPRGRELYTAAGTGAVVLGLGTGLLAFAEQTVPSGIASLFITTLPFWLVGVESLWGGERLHGPTIAGMCVGFAGTVLLLLPGGASVDSSMWSGFVLLQIGLIGWTAGSIYQRKQPAKANPLVIAAIQQLAAAVLYTPVFFLVPHAPVVWTVRATAALAYLVVFGSLVAYSAYVVAMKYLPVSIVSIYPYVNCVVAVWLGWLVYREPFGHREFLAMLVIFTGVGIVKWQGAKR